jgi:hypothetical protein
MRTMCLSQKIMIMRPLKQYGLLKNMSPNHISSAILLDLSEKANKFIANFTATEYKNYIAKWERLLIKYFDSSTNINNVR